MLDEYAVAFQKDIPARIEVIVNGFHRLITAQYTGMHHPVWVNAFETVEVPVFVTCENIDGFYEVVGLPGFYFSNLAPDQEYNPT